MKLPIVSVHSESSQSSWPNLHSSISKNLKYIVQLIICSMITHSDRNDPLPIQILHHNYNRSLQQRSCKCVHTDQCSHYIHQCLYKSKAFQRYSHVIILPTYAFAIVFNISSRASTSIGANIVNTVIWVITIISISVTFVYICKQTL